VNSLLEKYRLYDTMAVRSQGISLIDPEMIIPNSYFLKEDVKKTIGWALSDMGSDIGGSGKDFDIYPFINGIDLDKPFTLFDLGMKLYEQVNKNGR
jgi:hypothetical protein